MSKSRKNKIPEVRRLSESERVKIADVVEAVVEDITRREIELYQKKQEFLEKIFTKAENEDWLSAIAESKYGKRFLFELAVKAVEAGIDKFIPRKTEQHISGEGLKVLAEIRKVLVKDEKKTKK